MSIYTAHSFTITGTQKFAWLSYRDLIQASWPRSVIKFSCLCLYTVTWTWHILLDLTHFT
jgi:hypothetical protein